MARSRMPSFKKGSFRRQSFRKCNSADDIEKNITQEEKTTMKCYRSLSDDTNELSYKREEINEHYQEFDTTANIGHFIKYDLLTPDILDDDLEKTDKYNDYSSKLYLFNDIQEQNKINSRIDCQQVDKNDMEENNNNIVIEPTVVFTEKSSRWPWVLITILLLIVDIGGLIFWGRIPQFSRGVTFYYQSRSMPARHILDTSEFGLSQLPLSPQDNETLYFIIHGYGEASSMVWIQKLTKALLERDINSTIIQVDYWDLAELDGRRSCNNLKTVANEIAKLLDDLIDNKKLKLSQVHLIGYSLGGRVTGMVRHRLKTTGKIRRITALDSSHPWIPPYDESDYVDHEDAELVVTAKTSAISARTPPGHIDIIFNDGYLQPGCDHWMYPILVQQVCSHNRAFKYMAEAVTFDHISGCMKEERGNLSSQYSCVQFNILDSITTTRVPSVFSVSTNGERPFFNST